MSVLRAVYRHFIVWHVLFWQQCYLMPFLQLVHWMQQLHLKRQFQRQLLQLVPFFSAVHQHSIGVLFWQLRYLMLQHANGMQDLYFSH